MRGLRADPVMRKLLNRGANAIVQLVVQDNVEGLALARQGLRDLRDGLKEGGSLDDLFLAKALDGVLLLMTPR